MDDQSDHELSEDELQLAQDIISNARPDTYTLKQLYGDEWTKIISPTSFGSRFAKSVILRQLENIALHPAKTGANALQYIIKGG